MKIALLNLQYDNNYGGNLQRYALMKVLQRMGHDVTHLNLRFNLDSEPTGIKIKRTIWRLASCVKHLTLFAIFPERTSQKRYEQSCAVTDPFYDKYVKHTKVIDFKHKLANHVCYDAFLVGSDQVWRKKIAAIFGIDTFFFDYLPNSVQAKRIAYGVSLGTSVNELTDEDIKRLTPLYERFSAVSVREDSALDLFKQYKWNTPQAIQVLDPTLLLNMVDYMELINDGTTVPSAGNMFCYILDPSEEKDALIKEYEQKKGLKSFRVGINQGDKMCVQQWLRSFYDSEFIVTDSFHGMVFSIIFNKPFKLIYNPFRGNARFESLMKQLNIPTDTETIDWKDVNYNLSAWRNISIEFLKTNLC